MLAEYAKDAVNKVDDMNSKVEALEVTVGTGVTDIGELNKAEKAVAEDVGELKNKYAELASHQVAGDVGELKKKYAELASHQRSSRRGWRTRSKTLPR